MWLEGVPGPGIPGKSQKDGQMAPVDIKAARGVPQLFYICLVLSVFLLALRWAPWSSFRPPYDKLCLKAMAHIQGSKFGVGKEQPQAWPEATGEAARMTVNGFSEKYRFLRQIKKSMVPN